MTRTREAVDRFIAALGELPRRLGLREAGAVGSQLECWLVEVEDGARSRRGTVGEDVSYVAHGVGFALSWPGAWIDVDVDRAFLPDGPRRLVLDPWKVAYCGERMGFDTDRAEAEVYLRELVEQGLCDWSGRHIVWPPGRPRGTTESAA